MSGRRYTVNIDRLVLRGLDLAPAEAEQVRRRLTSELQTALAQRRWAAEATTIEQAQASLPALSVAEAKDPKLLAQGLARRLAQAIPGTEQAGTFSSNRGAKDG